MISPIKAYQQVFNPSPQLVDTSFGVRSYFLNGQKVVVPVLKAGEKVIMKVEVEASKEADFVQLEIPVPAGCTYGTKTTGSWYVHREYFRDKVLIFVERMSKGKYTYEIELEPRYNGNYTINPVNVMFIYFPVIYERNDISNIKIQKYGPAHLHSCCLMLFYF